MSSLILNTMKEKSPEISQFNCFQAYLIVFMLSFISHELVAQERQIPGQIHPDTLSMHKMEEDYHLESERHMMKEMNKRIEERYEKILTDQQTSSQSGPVSEQDSLALIALYSETNGDNWDDDTNWLSGEPVSTWYGITVQDNRVTAIVLRNNNLNGTIPPTLGNLTNLRQLVLSGNSLEGAIPPELGGLGNLEILNLGGNNLSGSIPSELGNLYNLLNLFLNNNNLKGSIPSRLGNLSNLEFLALYNNDLSGSIPPELGNLSNLGILLLYRNNLSGSLPPDLGNLVNMTIFQVPNNNLSGNIPPELGNLLNLRNLSLFGNEFNGLIPPEIGNLSNLMVLYIHSNILEGTIPSELGSLKNLERLYLHTNDLSGPIPNSLTQLSLEFFHYYDTNLCEPPDEEFQQWLAGIDNVRGTGVLCDIYVLGKQLNRIPSRISQRWRSTIPLRFSENGEIDGDRGPMNMVLRVKNPTDKGKYYRAVVANYKDPLGNEVGPNHGLFSSNYFYEIQPGEARLFRVYTTPPPPNWWTNFVDPGKWQVNIQIEEKDSRISLSKRIVESLWIPFYVIPMDEPLVESPAYDEDAIGHIMVPQSALTDQHSTLYNILQVLRMTLGVIGIDFGSAFIDYYQDLKDIKRQIKNLYFLRVKSEVTNVDTRKFEIRMETTGSLDFAYDRAIVSVLLPPDIGKSDILDGGGARIFEDEYGRVSLLWLINGVDKRIHRLSEFRRTPLFFKINEKQLNQYEIVTSLMLLIGPFQGDDPNFDRLEDAPWIYNYERWKESPSSMYWYPITFGVTKSLISNPVELSNTFHPSGGNFIDSNKSTQSSIPHYFSNGLILEDGTELFIPAFTFDQDVDVNWSQTNSEYPYPSNLEPSSNQYFLEFNDHTQEFENPVSIIVNTDSESQLTNHSIFRWDEIVSSWKQVPSISDSISRQITTEIKQTGTYRSFKSLDGVPLLPIELISPNEISTTNHNPIFKWNDPTELSWRYSIQIDSVDSFESPLISDNTVAEEFESSKTLREGTYYWRLRRTTLDGFTELWSSTAQFEIVADTTPPIFTFIYPDSGQIITPDSTIRIIVKDNETGINQSSIIFALDSIDIGFNYDPNVGEISSTVPSVLIEGTYVYSVSVEDLAGNRSSISIPFYLTITSVDNHEINNLTFKLSQNYPNPFNPRTTIDFSIPISGFVYLKVYNVLGQEVANLINEEKRAGRHSVIWDASGMASGVYLYRIQVQSFSETKKLIFLK